MPRKYTRRVKKQTQKAKGRANANQNNNNINIRIGGGKSDKQPASAPTVISSHSTPAPVQAPLQMTYPFQGFAQPLGIRANVPSLGIPGEPSVHTSNSNNTLLETLNGKAESIASLDPSVDNSSALYNKLATIKPIVRHELDDISVLSNDDFFNTPPLNYGDGKLENTKQEKNDLEGYFGYGHFGENNPLRNRKHKLPPNEQPEHLNPVTPPKPLIYNITDDQANRPPAFNDLESKLSKQIQEGTSADRILAARNVYNKTDLLNYARKLSPYNDISENQTRKELVNMIFENNLKK